MGRIYYVMGKSASGKDTIYKKILELKPELKTVVLYTTRPQREGEREGVEYHFTTPEALEVFGQSGKVIESRTYRTVCGPWIYATVDDGQIDLSGADYLVIGTLESFEKLKQYFGSSAVVPVYVYVEDGVRLERAMARERNQASPNYKELCRRFLADDEDFSAEHLKQAGITGGYENLSMESCLREILADMGD